MLKKITYFLFVFLLFSCGTNRNLTTIKDDGSARWAYVEGFKHETIWGDTASAITWFNEAIDRDSTYDVAWYELSRITNNALEAEHYAQKAVELDSTNLVYRSQLGWQMATNGKWDEALRFYNKLISDDPNNYLNYRISSILYTYKEQPFSAISVLDNAEIRLGQIDDLIHIRLPLLMEVRLYDRAVADASRILAENPNDIDALIVIAERAEQQGNETEYIAAIRKLFENPVYPFTNKRIIFERLTSDINFYRRYYFDVHTLATTLRLMYHNSYDALDLYAKHLLYTGDIDEALESYKSFLNNSNATIETYRMVIDIEGYLQKSDSVSKYATLAIEKYPRNSSLYISLGGSLLAMGDNVAAVKEFEKAVKYADTDSLKSTTLGILGDVYYQANLVQKCFSTYRKALKYDPNNVLVLNNYAYYTITQPDVSKKSLESALEMSHRANEVASSSSSLDTEGWILHLLGRNEEAKQLIMQAIALDSSKSPVLYYHYADVLEALGDAYMAEIYRKRAREAEGK